MDQLDIEVVRVDQDFVENRVAELLSLFRGIREVGPHYDADMILRQERFGWQLGDMQKYSRAILNKESGVILSVLLACALKTSEQFQETMYALTGQGLGFGSRLYISEVVTRSGQGFRGNGYATSNIEYAMTAAYEAGVMVGTLVTECSPSNQPVLDFYKKRGFVPYRIDNYAPPFSIDSQAAFLYRLTRPGQ